MRPTEQAFSVFLKDLKDREEDEQRNAVEQIKKFTNATRDSVLRWIRTGTLPNGLTFLKVRHLLSVLGYRKISLEEIPEDLQKLCKLLVHDAIKQSEVCAFLALSSGDELWRPVAEQKSPRNFSPERMNKVKEICLTNKDQFPIIEELDKNLQSIFFGGKTKLTQNIEISVNRSGLDFRNLRDTLSVVRFLAVSSLPELKKLLVNSSAEERVEFRNLFGTKEFFEFSNQQYELSNLLNGLCSEKSREIVIKKNKLD